MDPFPFATPTLTLLLSTVAVSGVVNVATKNDRIMATNRCHVSGGDRRTQDVVSNEKSMFYVNPAVG
uniref:Putative secreted protein n=1 Tax=Anopheles darlingi TaxID=43151 RepID=A0A2M4DH68_ANODA